MCVGRGRAGNHEDSGNNRDNFTAILSRDYMTIKGFQGGAMPIQEM